MAAVAVAEGGTGVTLHEAQVALGGRARTSAPPFRANLGPHVLYCDGPAWAWLSERKLVDDRSAPRAPLITMGAIRFRVSGSRRRIPPAAVVRALMARRAEAPVSESFCAWASRQWDPEVARLLSNLAGVFTFDYDPGRLSAAFVWDRLRRVFAPRMPTARYVTGGWGTLVDRLAERAGALGVEIRTGSAVERLPETRPVIVATELRSARTLLGDDDIRWEGSDVALLDVGIAARWGYPFVVSDLDAPGWVERFSAADRSLAPTGQDLVQVQIGLLPGETLEDGVRRAEDLLDCGYPEWRAREHWRRRSRLQSRSGALDLPGFTWEDRPAIDRGDGVFLAGDMVAAPGLLSEVGFNSALRAADLARSAEARGVAVVADP